jgi:DNA-nicking Smr family endonuclease
VSQRNGPPKKKEEGFHNNPFKSAIKALQKKPPEPPARPQPPPPPPKKKPAPEEDDASLFYAAMDGVQQLTHRGEAPAPNPRLPEIIDENAEALAQLSELVAGNGEFDISDSSEFIEGASPGLDRNLMRALRRGDFAVQGRLDLHGQTQAEAKESVERFLTESRRAGRRCVLIVHGRGLHSQDQLPVLKEGIKAWLSQKRIGKLVLAFATARPQDGGAGAVYVLLRR